MMNDVMSIQQNKNRKRNPLYLEIAQKTKTLGSVRVSSAASAGAVSGIMKSSVTYAENITATDTDRITAVFRTLKRYSASAVYM
ncbi:MAG: hypothetical protein ACLSVG_05765 [Clostridia bacterium]